VGTYAVQIAAALGAEVTGACSTRNAGLVRSIGAAHVVDYMTEDFTDGRTRYDVILDNVSSLPLSRLRGVLTPRGTFVLNGGGSPGHVFGPSLASCGQLWPARSSRSGVYVDNDPLVLVHARALLTSTPGGLCDYIDADLRDPAAILGAAAGPLDFKRPVALMLMGIMGHFTDEEAYPIVSRLLDGLPSGSYFALDDGANVNEAFSEAQRGYNESGAVPYYLRSPEQFARFFEGMELVEPGVVPVPHWRPDSNPSGKPAEIYSYCDVGRKR
jgi:S-adenosyl methyltransferase